MALIEVGTGPPLVLVPGIQGRWEYQKPTIDALARRFRVLTFPLSGEPGSGHAFEPELGLDNYTRQILLMLDATGVSHATICGISFGGLAAARFAKTYPGRTTSLVLVSTPGPVWHLRSRHKLYARFPIFFSPLFLVETPFRLRAELAVTFPRFTDRCRFSLWQLRTLLRKPVGPSRMAARATLIAENNIADDCRKIAVPTLVVTGEADLDRVVAVQGTMAYLNLIQGARHKTLEGTGHLGSVTRAEAFAALVQDFVDCGADAHARQLGRGPA